MASQLLDEKIREEIGKIFAGLNEPVALLFFGSEEQGCEYCAETQQLLEELASLSAKLHLRVYDIDRETGVAEQFQVEYAPAIVIAGLDGDDFVDHGIRFVGVPAGHEFTSLIRGILMVSSGESGLSQDTKEFLAGLEKPVHLQVFVTPTCPYCPQAVALAHQMAMESPLVEAEMIEAMEFPELANQFSVSGVPHTIINAGAGEIVGAVPEAVLTQKIQQVLLDEA